MLLTQIEAMLLDPDLIGNWQATLAEWEEATPHEVEQALTWIVLQRDQFIQAARDIDEPEALDMIVAVRYIELKSHWILLNTQINYLVACKGETELSLAYRASLISQLLEALECLIEEDDIERIVAFLTEPITMRAA